MLAYPPRLAWTIVVGSAGGSPGAILSTASMPEITLPNDGVMAFEIGLGTNMMKNWLFALSGDSTARAADPSAQERHRGEFGLEVGKSEPPSPVPWIAALGHEAGNHPVERQPVVEAAPDERLDSRDVMGREVGPAGSSTVPPLDRSSDQPVRRIGGDLRRARRCSARAARPAGRGGDQRSAANGNANKALVNMHPSRIMAA